MGLVRTNQINLATRLSRAMLQGIPTATLESNRTAPIRRDPATSRRLRFGRTMSVRSSPRRNADIIHCSSTTSVLLIHPPLLRMTEEGINCLAELSLQIREEALAVERDEPELSCLLRRTILAPSVVAFDDAVASTVCYRLLLTPCTNGSSSNGSSRPTFCPNSLQALIRDAIASPMLELGHTMADAIQQDALAVCRRDPATDTLLEVVLFSKGYAALVCHRVAYRLWHSTTNRKKHTALFLQSQASAAFGLDLHPAAQLGAGIMLDHGTGVVIGETAVVGDGCTLLHGVTLGGTGKDHGDRHPKIAQNVLIGAGSSILGNIKVGSGAKIGAGSVVLRDIPAGATAVGAPAKIIGKATESSPGSDVDETLEHVSFLHKSKSVIKLSVSSQSTATTESESDEEDLSEDGRCPWREYARMAKLAPKGTVTLCTLRHLLSPEGCSIMEIGLCFLELDEKNVGYVYKSVFRDKGAQAILKHTELDEARARALVDSYVNGSFPSKMVEKQNVVKVP